MKLRLKENPKEWRKQVWLGAMGLILICCILRWRGALHGRWWPLVPGIGAAAALTAWVKPRWFRGYYRMSMRLGFVMSLVIGRLVLACIFVLLFIPIGVLLRLAGKDPLMLRRRNNISSNWTKRGQLHPLDRLF